jgi:large subunit ribosomal protein L17
LTGLTRNLLIQQSIRTTLHKARAATPLIERVISLAKLNTLAAKREVFRILGDHKLVALAFNEIGPRFAKIQGGYTRIINLDRRRGDDAKLVILELTEIKKKEAKKPKKEKEIRPEEEKKAGITKEKPVEEKKPEAATAVKEKPPIIKKPTKKFLGGLRNIFKKERDSL